MLFVNVKSKGILVVSTIILLSIISSVISFQALFGQPFIKVFTGSPVFGDVGFKVDALSAWFILIINFTFITGSLYGLQYMKKYLDQTSKITVHCVCMILTYVSMIGASVVQNAMAFLIFWEVMAVSAFMLVIFESNKQTTLKAGLNYLIQSHISIVFLMLGFMFVAFKTGSYSFEAITAFSSSQPAITATVLFFLFFIGFAIKAGFVPFHTWLPVAHPAAPAHVSGIMSGVLIKIGIYGILRMLLLIRADYCSIGYIILIISVFSGVYGVSLAIIQHDLKKLLAYHSIENIGIIGIGIGLGSIGIGTGNILLSVLGFSGALLHTLNHSLFKSLLFYSAGNIYQSAHTLNIEKLGGVIRYMPHTAFLFLISAIAICGLPPLNGFISEFIIYGGLYSLLLNANAMVLAVAIFSIIGLVAIGGLALMCFTKAFGVVFLGNIRQKNPNPITEMSFSQLFPMYLIAFLMIFIGLFSPIFINLVQIPVSQFVDSSSILNVATDFNALKSVQYINWYSALFLGLILLLFFVRRSVNRKKIVETNVTWACAYKTSDYKLQYTASSFIKSFSKLMRPFLSIHRETKKPDLIFPVTGTQRTHPYDKIEEVFIDKPLKGLKWTIGKFVFLQSGRIQQYILYGIIFITSVIIIPLLIEKISQFVFFLNNI